MSTEYTIVIEKDEDGYYVGSVPGLPGCHTQGKSIDQLLERMEEAIALWLEVEGEEGEDAPNPLELVGIQEYPYEQKVDSGAPLKGLLP